MDNVFEYLIKRFESEIDTGSSSPAHLTTTLLLFVRSPSKFLQTFLA